MAAVVAKIKISIGFERRVSSSPSYHAREIAEESVWKQSPDRR